MLTSQYLKILVQKAEQIENGTMPDTEIPNAFMLFKHHNLTDLSLLDSPSATLGTLSY